MNNLTTPQIMRHIVLALIPAIMVKTMIWGFGTLYVLATAVFTGLMIEVLCGLIRYKKFAIEIRNFSGIVTTVILALSLPSSVPYYIVIICTTLAILVAKQFYGGLGQNIFNPAMVGMGVFLVAYPQFFTYWLNPIVKDSLASAWQAFIGNPQIDFATKVPTLVKVDAYTSATSLTSIKTLLQTSANSPELQSQLVNLTARDYENYLIYALSFIVGGAYLLVRKIISWQLPVFTLVGFVAVSLLHYLVTGYPQARPDQSLVLGSIIFASLFIVTDPVTAPQYGWGRILYALIIGALAYIIRAWSNYNDGVAFAVLFANLLVPLFDRVFVPKEFGK